ncbi:FUSC family protein [Crenobacter sp. SG2303]|uniref:FUSC family protein n=1 Tax=Crenobacter oryzisoli TaxID=3056844 RepID=A0ABT7XIV7_9NEIS|nr:FUSC family protein [Crenobacter sp. SG2303]MDN0073724.1 FUSC family protein [Crenobacter sp. SG2303]
MPTWRDWLFSAKAFTAAMLALYIALMLDLPRPYWAMATVYIVSHPLTGATRSKALYRVCGTLLGAAAAVVFVPLFVNAPVLLSLVVSLWMGTLLSISLLDRTPRNYVFMLAAYTLLIIGLPSVFQPETVFDTAVARSEEILVGIGCASVVATLIFPNKVAPVLSARLDAWLKDAALWAAESLSPALAAASDRPASRHRLAADILALDHLITQLTHDSGSASTVRHARELRGRMSMLLPILSSLTETTVTLRKLPQGIPSELSRLMDDIALWMTRGGDAARLLHELEDATKTGEPGWDALLVSHAKTRLCSLIHLWQDCLSLQRMIAVGEAGEHWQPAYRRWEVGGKTRHYDYGMLLFTAGMATLGIFCMCLIWIGLGWDDGVSGVILGAIVCCVFASLDEPAPLIKAFFTLTCVSIALSAVLLFAMIPAAHEFEMLVAMLALPFLGIGVLMVQPQFGVLAMLLAMNTANFLGLQDTYSANFTVFINSNLAGGAGVLFALVWTLVTRPFGTELAIRRLVHSSWKALAQMAAGARLDNYANLIAWMLDCLSLLMPRLAASGHDTLTDGFSELRVGFSALDLQRDEHGLDEPARSLIQQVLQSVAEHYRCCADERRALTVSPRLAANIDAALRAVSRETGPAAREALQALVELRITLLPDAAPLTADHSGPHDVERQPIAEQGEQRVVGRALQIIPSK